MKKNLKFLTAIVLLITVLVACGGSTGKKKTDSTPEGNGTPVTQIALKPAPDDTTRVDIFLKKIEIDGEIHLEMYDAKKPGCPVIDNLETLVHAGDTIIFKKAPNSKVKEVTEIRIEYPVTILPFEDFKVDSGLYVLIINPNPPDSTIIVKYEIDFTFKNNGDTITIDPYLKIPDQ